jgi:hypothetical protein
MSGAIPQNVNYAVKGSCLIALAKKVPALASKLRVGIPGDRRPDDPVARVEDASGMVITY